MLNVTAEHVFMGNGVSELIDLTLRALLNPGDEVLIPAPDYPLWTAATVLNGGRAVYYPCPETRCVQSGRGCHRGADHAEDARTRRHQSEQPDGCGV